MASVLRQHGAVVVVLVMKRERVIGMPIFMLLFHNCIVSMHMFGMMRVACADDRMAHAPVG
jgi:hypothetical protein